MVHVRYFGMTAFRALGCIGDEPTVNIGHPGMGLGFTSFKFYLPKSDVSVIVLENLFYEDSDINFHFEKEIRKIVMNSNLVKK